MKIYLELLWIYKWNSNKKQFLFELSTHNIQNRRNPTKKIAKSKQ
jgi:hypothetical protein